MISIETPLSYARQDDWPAPEDRATSYPSLENASAKLELEVWQLSGSVRIQV